MTSRAPAGSWNHGTINAYRHKGCRCEECVTRYEDYRRKEVDRGRARRHGKKTRNYDGSSRVDASRAGAPRACGCGEAAIGVPGGDCLKCGRAIRPS